METAGRTTRLMVRRQQLPDYLTPGIRILFVGINPGLRSAAVGHHFAGYSNRFWKLLYDAGLVPVPLTHEDDRRLPEWGLGLTNVVARASSGMHLLKTRDYVEGRRRLLAKIRRNRPALIALLGLTLYPVLCPTKRTSGTTQSGRQASRHVGLQPDMLGGVPVFLLPNPSGRNAHYSYHEMLRAFRALRRHLLLSKSDE